MENETPIENEDPKTEIKSDTKDPTVKADPLEIKKSGHNEVFPPEIWEGIKEREHMLIVGPSGAGKTFWMNRMLNDQKIFLPDELVIVGDKHVVTDLVTSTCNNFRFNHEDYMKLQNNVKYFSLSELEKANNYLLSSDEKRKLALYSDIQTVDSAYKSVAMFLNRAKNFNVTCIIECHHLINPLLKNAAKHLLFLNYPVRSVGTALQKKITDPTLVKYEHMEGHEKVLFADNINSKNFYNANYIRV